VLESNIKEAAVFIIFFRKAFLISLYIIPLSYHEIYMAVKMRLLKIAVKEVGKILATK
jgi:hypothetical protein